MDAVSVFKINSRRLAYILRHDFEKYDLSFNRDGSVLLVDLADKLGVSVRDIEDVVAGDADGRFLIFSRNGLIFIKALYGHNRKFNIEPSGVAWDISKGAFLYHGTPEVNVDLIMENGLKPMSRNFVHLTTNFDMALSKGERFKKSVNTVILVIDVEEMLMRDLVLFDIGNGIVLTDFVPADCIKLF